MARRWTPWDIRASETEVMMTNESQATIFHVTHWKAGSQWVYGILAACAPKRIVVPKVKIAHFYEDAIVRGRIYPTVYVPHDKFTSVLSTQGISADDTQIKSFFVIRDLRDALVSLYFSLKVSHPIISESVAEDRRQLNIIESEEEALLYMVKQRGQASANIQRTWLPVCQAGKAMFVRYEDLIANEQQEFAKIIEYCQIDISTEKLTEIVDGNSFNKRAGRKRGDEDVSSHFRKGVSGDWKNHFTDRIKAEFKKKYGQLLIDTGYEKDLSW
jgi:Sulfotransferase domain